RSVVVLPAPVGPSRTTKEPSGIVIDTPSSATWPAKLLVMPSRTTSAMAQHSFIAFGQQRQSPLAGKDGKRAADEVQPDQFARPYDLPGRDARLQVAVGCFHRDDLRRAKIFRRD